MDMWIIPRSSFPFVFHCWLHSYVMWCSLGLQLKNIRLQPRPRPDLQSQIRPNPAPAGFEKNQIRCNPNNNNIIINNTIAIIMICAALVPKLFPRKSQQSALVHILPVVWSLIGSTPSAAGGVASSAASLRSATERLVGALYLEIGESLLDAANNASSVSLRARQNLRQILEDTATVSRSWNTPPSVTL